MQKKFLLEFVKRDLTERYVGSILGIWWSFLWPLVKYFYKTTSLLNIPQSIFISIFDITDTFSQALTYYIKFFFVLLIALSILSLFFYNLYLSWKVSNSDKYFVFITNNFEGYSIIYPMITSFRM